MTEPVAPSQEALEVRSKLMAIVMDDVAAYEIAIAFVADETVKLDLFTRHWAKCAATPQLDQRAANTVTVADERWKAISI